MAAFEPRGAAKHDGPNRSEHRKHFTTENTKDHREPRRSGIFDRIYFGLLSIRRHGDDWAIQTTRMESPWRSVVRRVLRGKNFRSRSGTLVNSFCDEPPGRLNPRNSGTCFYSLAK